MDPLPSLTRHAPGEAVLSDPPNFINRELSNFAFIERVLEEAADPLVPLLERLRFLSLLSTALDEFFMIRVAGLKQQLSGHVEETGPDAMSPGEQFHAISERSHAMSVQQDAVLLDDILPRLEKAGIRLLRGDVLSSEAKAAAAAFVERQVLPVLTPLALDPGHPFPHLRNKSLNLVVRFAPTPEARLRYGVVPVPAFAAAGARSGRPSLPRGRHRQQRLAALPRHGHRRLLQINAAPDEPAAQFLASALKLGDKDIYAQRRPLAVADFLVGLLARQEMKGLGEEPLVPALPAALGEGGTGPLEAMQQHDLLLHHPYESFEPVVSFTETAADDPDVLAIKIALYRTGEGNAIVRSLQRAAENGKQVTALIELKARMDEEANILWARELEQAGVHVVYGLIGYKTHCKLALVVRREGGKMRRYLHLGTGNYNPVTARSYSDLSLFTCSEEMADDATALFNLLTGYSRPTQWRKLLVAPLGMKQAVLQLIAEEARSGEQGRIVAKMNALADPEVIKALRRLARGSADRSAGARHLLPAARRAGNEREHPGGHRGRPLPRARAHLALSRPRREEGVPRLRRLDAAQFRPAGGCRLPHRGPGSQRKGAGRNPRHHAGRQQQGADAQGRRHLRAAQAGAGCPGVAQPGAVHRAGAEGKLRRRLAPRLGGAAPRRSAQALAAPAQALRR